MNRKPLLQQDDARYDGMFRLHGGMTEDAAANGAPGPNTNVMGTR